MSSEYRKRGSQSAAALTAVGSPHTNRHLEHPVIDETEKDISIEELQDFMSADLFEVQADPTFKNRLRETHPSRRRPTPHRRRQTAGGDETGSAESPLLPGSVH